MGKISKNLNAIQLTKSLVFLNLALILNGTPSFGQEAKQASNKTCANSFIFEERKEISIVELSTLTKSESLASNNNWSIEFTSFDYEDGEMKNDLFANGLVIARGSDLYSKAFGGIIYSKFQYIEAIGEDDYALVDREAERPTKDLDPSKAEIIIKTDTGFDDCDVRVALQIDEDGVVKLDSKTIGKLDFGFR